MVRAADGNEAGDGPVEVRRPRVPHEATEGVPDDEHLPAPRDALHLLDGVGQVFEVVVLDALAAFAPEMARSPVPPQVEVEHVEPCLCEVIGEAPGGQVPRIPVLPESMDEQDRRPGRPPVLRHALPDHRQGHFPAGDDDLLHERSAQAAVDGLVDEVSVEYQAGRACLRRMLRLRA